MVEEVMQSLLFVSCLCMYVPVCEQNNSKLWTDLDDIFRVDCLWDMDRVIKSWAHPALVGGLDIH